MNARRLFALCAAVGGLVACDDDVPDTTGDLVRPAGFALVDRGREEFGAGLASQLGSSVGLRYDVFVADSESQGVRAFQVVQTPTTAEDAFLSQIFVPSPSIFFPLVMPAPGFPIEVAATDQDRAYVLSPGSFVLDGADGAPTEFTGALHVLSVPELGFTLRPEEGFVPLAAPTNLADWVPGAIPVDLQLLSSSADEDRVAVLFDAFGAAGAVVVATFDAAGAVTDRVTTPVGRAPRDLAFDEARGLLLVAHAAEADAGVHQLAWDGATLSPGPVLDVGGPVSAVVLAPDTSTSGADQALALRLDVTAVKRLVAAPGAPYAVDTRPSDPLLAPEGAAGAEAGLVFLPAAAVTGAKGFVEAFPDPLAELSEDERRLLRPAGFERTNVPTVMLALLDGRAAFLSGDPLRLRLDRNPRVVAVREATPDAGQLSIVDCGTSSLQCEGGALNDCASGGASSIGLARLRSTDTTYAARYRGNLLSARALRYTAERAATQTGTVTLTLTADLEGRLVARGDAARAQLASLGECAEPLELVGVVSATTAAGRVQISVAGEGAAAADGCLAPDAPVTGTVDRLEVYPSAEEVVFTRLDAERRVVEVQARVPVFNSRAQVRADLEFAVAIGPDPACAPRPVGQVQCAGSTVCGPGRTCEPAMDDCPSFCTAECLSTDDCRPDLALRDCPGVTIEVDPVDLTLFDLDAASDASSAEEVNAVPYRTEWLPLAGGRWLTSFPGSRTIVRLGVRASGYETQLTR